MKVVDLSGKTALITGGSWGLVSLSPVSLSSAVRLCVFWLVTEAESLRPSISYPK